MVGLDVAVYLFYGWFRRSKHPFEQCFLLDISKTGGLWRVGQNPFFKGMQSHRIVRRFGMEPARLQKAIFPNVFPDRDGAI